MEATTNNVRIVVRIIGAFSDLLEIQAKLYKLHGQIVNDPQTGSVSKMADAWWYFEMTMENQESTNPVILKALAALDQVRDDIINLSNDIRFSMEMDCTITIEIERPVIELSQHAVKKLAEYGFSMGFDVYDYRGEDQIKGTEELSV